MSAPPASRAPKGGSTGVDPSPAPSVADRVYAEIFAEVAAGRYVAGERLTESRLATGHRVSRVPLREVLKRMAAEGILDLYPNRGAVVRVLSREDIHDYFEVRMALEGFASELVAAHIDRADNRDYFFEVVADMRRPHPDHGAEAFTEHDDLVHGGIVRRCGNKLLARQWQLLPLPLHRLRHFAGTNTWDFAASMQDHEEILAAVTAGRPDEAREQMVAHLDRVVQRVLSLDQKEFDGVFNPGWRD
ncbi:GntR family transcriptional regulator [Janibacter terrae]|uniref:GntR family transcriptional regulator n=1 Tax=Janibacter terrae TaxID=103817 RepID=UPI00146CA93F|nr:GntR family transcriptional regulator [Janibacter terrae]